MKALVLVAGACLAVSACTNPQLDHAADLSARVCQSAPLALEAYQVALNKGDTVTIARLRTVLAISCPAVLIGLEAAHSPS